MRYCVFWYPTIFHAELEENIENKEPYFSNIKEDISDKSENKYNIEISLIEKKNINIKGELLIGNEVCETFEFILKQYEAHKNGLVCYEIDETFIKEKIKDKYNSFMEVVLKKDIYHMAKKFYHKHESEPERDGALLAYLAEEGSKRIEINTEDNEVLMYFLNLYVGIFKKYVYSASKYNALAEELTTAIIILKNDENIGEEDKEQIENYERELLGYIISIDELCEKALIEYIYCKTLLSSRYNISFKYKTETIRKPQKKITSEEDNKKNNYRIGALNIKNSIRYIKNIKYKNQNRLSKLSQILMHEMKIITEETKTNSDNIKSILEGQKTSNKMMEVLSWASVIFGLIFGAYNFIGNSDNKNIVFGLISSFVFMCFLFRLLYIKNFDRINSFCKKSQSRI